ncbi:GNAT family N-acetyltransferase [Anaerosporobacter sp.]|uniref:GNAT family N-acetyltransferase n=1 Tax=Anaerosporobacter sp. TaxID=1872529 RepID=UPI00286F43B8|nr:GNAT family N-acetyltransferase [Anaerosporobacter sp.]
MKIEKIEDRHIDAIVNIAFEEYKKERMKSSVIAGIPSDIIKDDILQKNSDAEGYVAIEDGNVIGYLFYGGYSEEINNYFYVPIGGLGAVGDNRGKIISMLFETFAKEKCTQGKNHFDIKLYAHDDEIIRILSFLQFGIESEQGIYAIENKIDTTDGIIYKELSKEELHQKWSEVWRLVDQIVKHLQDSPIFYPGEEFTEEVYKEFFEDENTRVFAAIKNELLIGIIETNPDRNDFITNWQDCFNIGEIFVEPEYRHLGVAQELFRFAASKVREGGIEKLWVEHGTANPAARGFWNKYFESYCYAMTRDIIIG